MVCVFLSFLCLGWCYRLHIMSSPKRSPLPIIRGSLKHLEQWNTTLPLTPPWCQAGHTHQPPRFTQSCFIGLFPPKKHRCDLLFFVFFRRSVRACVTQTKRIPPPLLPSLFFFFLLLFFSHHLFLAPLGFSSFLSTYDHVVSKMLSFFFKCFVYSYS